MLNDMENFFFLKNVLISPKKGFWNRAFLDSGCR